MPDLDDEALREQAIENVDRKHGYTMEFSSCPKEHAREYDDEEARLKGAHVLSR